MSAEVRHLIAGSLKGHSQLPFSLKPAMVSGDANAHNFSGTLRTFSFHFVLPLHFQLRISGRSWPCSSMYCLCSLSLS